MNIDTDIDMALFRAALAGDSEAVSHALDHGKLLRCVEKRQYKNKMSLGSQIRIAGNEGLQYEVDDLPVSIYGGLDYSRNYIYPNMNGKTAIHVAVNPKVLYILQKHGWDVSANDYDGKTIAEFENHIYQEFTRLKLLALDNYFIHNEQKQLKEYKRKLSGFAREHKKWIRNKTVRAEPSSRPEFRLINRASRPELIEEDIEDIKVGDVVEYINDDGFTALGDIVQDDNLHKSYIIVFNNEEYIVPYDDVLGKAFHLSDLPEWILTFEKDIYVYNEILRKVRSNKNSKTRHVQINENLTLLKDINDVKKKSIDLLKKRNPEIHQLWYQEKNKNPKDKSRNATLKFCSSKVGH
jgi:hypothetical protein